ncbi:unnamed protein product, partial [Didymodactylos carnosus]
NRWYHTGGLILVPYDFKWTLFYDRDTYKYDGDKNRKDFMNKLNIFNQIFKCCQETKHLLLSTIDLSIIKEEFIEFIKYFAISFVNTEHYYLKLELDYSSKILHCFSFIKENHHHHILELFFKSFCFYRSIFLDKMLPSAIVHVSNAFDSNESSFYICKQFIEHLKYKSYNRKDTINDAIEFISEMIIVDTSNNCSVIIATMINKLLSSFIFDIRNNRSLLTIEELMNLLYLISLPFSDYDLSLQLISNYILNISFNCEQVINDIIPYLIKIIKYNKHHHREWLMSLYNYVIDIIVKYTSSISNIIKETWRFIYDEKETDCNCEHCSKLIQFIYDSKIYQHFIDTNINESIKAIESHLNEIIKYQIKLPLELLSDLWNNRIIITKVKTPYEYYKEQQEFYQTTLKRFINDMNITTNNKNKRTASVAQLDDQ